MFDWLGIFDSSDVLDGDNVIGGARFEVCNQLLPNGLADLLGMELL